MRFNRVRRGVFCRCELARRFSNYRRFVIARLRKVPEHFDQAKTYYESEAGDYDQRSQKMHVPLVAHREPLDPNSVFFRRHWYARCRVRRGAWSFRHLIAPHEIETEGMESTEDYRSC